MGTARIRDGNLALFDAAEEHLDTLFYDQHQG